MEGEGSGHETTCFSENEIFFNYFKSSEVAELLEEYSMKIEEILEEKYIEENGDETRDIFIIARKSI